MSARVIRRLRAVAASRDAGMTLTEVLVGMTLSTILGALTTTLFVSMDTSSASTTDRTINSSSARNTVQAWTSYLRVADGPTTGSKISRIEWMASNIAGTTAANDILFYADLANRSMTSVGTTAAPTMVWLRRDSTGSLIEEFFPATASANASPTSCRSLGATVAASSTPLFSALDSSGNSMTGLDLGSAPAATAGCVNLPVTVPSRSRNPDTAAVNNLQNVYSVTIDFVLTDTRNSHPVEFTSQAVLPTMGGV